MGKEYTHITASERGVISYLRERGWSYARIGAQLGRAASSIQREYRRNSKPSKAWDRGYDPERAHGLAKRRRRWDARFKMARQPDLRGCVRDRLAMGWSPEQIAGRLAREEGGMIISHESIYRYIYHKSAQKDPSWHRLLPRKKHRRGRLGKRGGSAKNRIRDRVSLDKRSETAADRREPGHWEADLMVCKNRTNLLVAQERTSRFIVVSRHLTKEAAPIADRLLDRFRVLPELLRRTVTFDNGTEFAEHWKLNEEITMSTFFCDTHSPWQKGGVENAIGRLRRLLPGKTDLEALTARRIDAVARRYNSTPRKCLGYKTPNEVFRENQQALHFNRESIISCLRA